MAGRSGNGSVTHLTVRVLREIRDEIRGLRGEMNERLDAVNHRLDETNLRLGRLEDRFDHFLTTAGSEVKSLRDRVDRLDHRVVRLERR